MRSNAIVYLQAMMVIMHRASNRELTPACVRAHVEECFGAHAMLDECIRTERKGRGESWISAKFTIQRHDGASHMASSQQLLQKARKRKQQ
jgi:hypothetical protein